MICVQVHATRGDSRGRPWHSNGLLVAWCSFVRNDGWHDAVFIRRRKGWLPFADPRPRLTALCPCQGLFVNILMHDPAFPASAPEDFRVFIRGLLRKEPSQRLGIAGGAEEARGRHMSQPF